GDGAVGRVDEDEVAAAALGSGGDDAAAVGVPLDPGDVAGSFGDLPLLPRLQVAQVEVVPAVALGGAGEGLPVGRDGGPAVLHRRDAGDPAGLAGGEVGPPDVGGVGVVVGPDQVGDGPAAGDDGSAVDVLAGRGDRPRPRVGDLDGGETGLVVVLDADEQG